MSQSPDPDKKMVLIDWNHCPSNTIVEKTQMIVSQLARDGWTIETYDKAVGKIVHDVRPWRDGNYYNHRGEHGL